jgi:putative polyhydroxyalkanoate system protein
MKLELSHSLSRDEAKRRIEKLAQYWSQQYGVTANWNGDSVKLNGKVKGIAFDATVQIADKVVHAEGTDPGFLIRAAATAYLKQKLADYLDPKKTDADLAKLA